MLSLAHELCLVNDCTERMWVPDATDVYENIFFTRINPWSRAESKIGTVAQRAKRNAA